jgi:hypothetical protein
MEKLVEYKKQKLEMEHQLYGRFLEVLNSKKKYIQLLEDRLFGTIITLLILQNKHLVKIKMYQT